jgi:hypothetical protein
MKKTISVLCFLFIVLVYCPFAAAQASSTLRGQSMNGSTGLFSIPSGHIGWEDSGSFGLDLGYRAVINNHYGIAHIPAVTMSILNWTEIYAAFDFQPKVNIEGSYENNEDLLLGLKMKLPSNNPSIALGGNFQFINIVNKSNLNYIAYQPYLAITYSGTFLNTSSETTVALGKTFYSHGPGNNSDIDFGMGFNLVLFDDVFGNTIHWIIDFANFSYSDNAWPNQVKHRTGPDWYRGTLNTGLRIDLSVIPVFSEFKFLIDLVFNDLFDAGGRSFTAGAVLGFSVP